MARKRKPAPKIELYSSSSSSSDEDEEEEEQQQQQEDDADEEEDVEEEEEEEEEEEVEESSDSEDEEEEEEEEDEESKRESVRKLLQPFGKDQLIDLIKSAALENPSIAARLHRFAESDPTHRKIFVHGLGWDATSETLISAFEPYGSIEDCNVVTDKLTGKSKGYGFVLFDTRSAARKALKQPQKKIGGRMTACQLASAGPVNSQAAPDAAGRKIYVSGVGPGIDVTRLRAFFERFGEIEIAPPACGRGFAIFTYKTVEGCRKALEEPKKVFEGYQLHCQRAFESPQSNQKPVVLIPGIMQPGILQPNNLALNYTSPMMGLNPGFPGHQSLNSVGSALVGQNLPLGAGLAQTAGTGLSPSVNRSGMMSPYGSGLGSLGLGGHSGLGSAGLGGHSGLGSAGLGGHSGLGSAGLSGQSGINSISPSVIGSYQSQAALQGLSAYQGAHSSHSPVAAARAQSGIGSFGGYASSYFGRQ